jgi:hypothetical protein
MWHRRLASIFKGWLNGIDRATLAVFDRAHYSVASVANGLYRWTALLAVLVSISIVWVSFSRTTVIQLEAESEVFTIHPSEGRPLEWAMTEAKLVECKPSNRPPPAEANAFTLALTRGVKIQITDSTESTLIRIEPIDGSQQCQSSPAASLSSADGMSRSPISIPAEIVINRLTLKDDINLLFFGKLVAGDEVAVTQQAILKQGKITLIESTPKLLESIGIRADSEFISKERLLNSGDRIQLGAANGGGSANADARGFIKIDRKRQFESLKPPSVIAVSYAKSAVVVRPFSTAKTVEASYLSRFLHDPIIHTGIGVIALALFALAKFFFEIGKNHKDGDSDVKSETTHS